ncbi:MAG: hypothetical protein ACK5XB_04485 [Rhodospirillales bacterium]|jgi:hypothetical protein
MDQGQSWTCLRLFTGKVSRSIMNAGQIARAHFAAAMAQAEAEGQDRDAVGRTLLAEIVKSMLLRRSIRDVRAEILAAADNVDPETDYMFMRP